MVKRICSLLLLASFSIWAPASAMPGSPLGSLLGSPLDSVSDSPAGAEGMETIFWGENVTFTTMNFHETAFEADPNNPGLPAPSLQFADASGNEASTLLIASPGEAGVARARVGLEFDINPGAFDWDDVKDLPIEVAVAFTYTLDPEWTGLVGSANAGVAVDPFTSPWYDFRGFESGESGSETRT